MPNQNVLTEKESALIAIGASVAAGCQPCTAYHVKAARESGATPEQIRAAVAIARRIKRTAEQKLAAVIGDQSAVAEPCCPQAPSPGPNVAAGQPGDCGCR